MSDEIKLTLDPTPESEAAQIQVAADEAQAAADAAQAAAQADIAAPAAPDAAAAVQADPAAAAVASAVQDASQGDAAVAQQVTQDALIRQQFTEEERKMISEFSDSALKNVKTKDLEEIGDQISSLVAQLKGFDTDEQPKGFLGLFRKKTGDVVAMKARFDDAEVNVDRIVAGLEQHLVQLLKDIAMLDRLYEQNLRYFKELSMYIAAGRERLESFRAHELADAVAKAEASGLPEDAQAAKDLRDKADRFEKKLYDLELTRNISIQMAPQIRMIQASNQLMAEKIQTSIVNTIPLWKSQMVLALGVAHTQQAMEAQRMVTDLTNELLQKNAEKLHMASVESAKEAERGIVDIETLKSTNQMLISTMDEVLTIQQQGREKRRAAEQQLADIETQLRKKLLETRE